MPHDYKRAVPLLLAVAATATGPAWAADATSDIAAPEVRVNVDRLQIERDQASVPVQVLDREQIDRSAVQDLTGALALLPNVNIQRTGSLFDEGSVNMYGISGQARAPTRTVIAVNGVPLNNGMFPETSLNMIPLNIVERIEVIQGPGSSAYGNNAFTGVVNIVTRQPRETTGNVTSQIGTRWQTSDNSAYVGVGKPGEAWGVASVQLRETLGNLQPDGSKAFSDSRLKNVALLGEKRFGDTTFSGGYLYYDYDRHNPSLITRTATGIGPTPTSRQEDGDRQHVNFGVRQSFSDQWEGELRYTYNQSSDASLNTFPVGQLGFPTVPAGNRPSGPTDEDRSGNGALARLTWTTERNILQVGYEFADAKLTNNLATGTQTREFTGTSNGFYVQDRFLMFDEQLSLSAGYRFDSFSFYDKNSNSGKVGFSYKPTGASWLVRGNVGRSFSAPAFNQLFNSAQPFGNPNLTAETLTLYELGGELTPVQNLRLGLTGFYAKHKDPIFPRQLDQCVAPAPGVPAGVNQFCNVFPPPEYVGATLTADWAFAQYWILGASYTYTDPRTVTGTKGATTIINTYTFHSNKHVLKATLAYTRERFTIAGDFIGAQGRYWGDNFTGPVDDYTVLNVRATYKVDAHWTLLATFYNVFDESYATRSDRAVIGGVERFAGITQPGSFAMLGASYTF